MNTTTRTAQEHRFTTFDNTELFYRYWPAQIAEGQKPRGLIVMFHRGHEHSGRMQHIVDELGRTGYAFAAWDARGHGQSPGERGYSPSFGASVRDIDFFVKHLHNTYGFTMPQTSILAQSVGAVIATAWVHDYAPNIRALVLASPAFKVKLYVPMARQAVKLWSLVHGNFFVNSYVKAHYLTHDPQRIASFNADPLITRPISANMLSALYDNAERLIADAGAITVPTQLLISGDDFVVEHAPQHTFYEKLGSKDRECHVFPGFYHDTLGEKDRHLALDKINAFLDRQYAQATAPEPLLNADQQGYTYNEYAALSSPGSLPLPVRAGFEIAKVALKTVGRLSQGVELGVQTGFDSGSTLDYIYRNRPEGKFGIGKAFDFSYLQQIGWRGIRQRKLNLEALITQAWRELAQANRPIRVLDIAAGHGRYVLDAAGAASIHGKPESILLRDYSELNVQSGQRMIAERGLTDIARFEKGDAFDQANLAAITPHPTLAIVSGLYELFPDNAQIQASLAGLAQCTEEGAYLVYTNQPWHPQLAFIAHVLSSHRNGKPWIMRRRTQAEMDQLVQAAGFRKIEQRIDEWGIFTVSLAIKERA